MSLGRTLLRFLFLAAIGHQVTYTVVEGEIFEDVRKRVGARPASPARKAANLAGDAILIALGTRLWNEILGWLRRDVAIRS